MYHGSRRRITSGYLEPHPSAATAGQATVFATPYIEFALQYTGRKWTDKDFEAGRIDDDFYIIEKRPGVFKRTYRGQKGYLYVVDPSTFRPLVPLTGASTSSVEFVSDVPVKILKTIRIEDAEREILKTDLDVIRYSDLNIIEFVKRGEDLMISDPPFNAMHLQTLLALDKRLFKVKTDSVDFAGINEFLFGVPGDERPFRKVGQTRDEPRFFVTWEPRKPRVHREKCLSGYSVFP